MHHLVGSSLAVHFFLCFSPNATASTFENNIVYAKTLAGLTFNSEEKNWSFSDVTFALPDALPCICQPGREQ